MMLLQSGFRGVAKCVAVLSAAVAVAGCGGGATIGVGGGYYDNYPYDTYPPQVSITTSSAYAPAGGYVDIAAAASDESGIYDVIFYRLDGNNAVALARLYAPPFQISAPVPADGRTRFSVYAEAADNAGRLGTSQIIDFPVR